MKIKWKPLLISILIPLFVGGAAALLSRGGMEEFDMLEKPALAPPGWLFPVVWTILYVLMGVASYLVIQSGNDVSRAIPLYTLSLVFNFFWPIIFFGFEAYLFAFFWLTALFIIVLLTAVSFYKASPAAGYLMIPYLLWVAFAGYLNLSIYLLN